MTVWDDLVGQEAAVTVLREAVAGTGMSHAWLFTGPPGSGRSVAARAFAAALQCPDGGCGHCGECTTALAGSHPDVDLVQPQGLSYGVADARALVLRAAGSPVRGRWKVTVVEDADRLTESALNVLLKSIEEPPPRGVWLLCAPSADDLLPTIRSRCRLVGLRTPPAAAVAAVLVDRDGATPEMAAFAARAAQGHVGRARRLVRDEGARNRRREVLSVPGDVRSVPACFVAAANLVDAAKEEATAAIAELDKQELSDLQAALGATDAKARPRGTAGAFRDLEERQKSRATRLQRDALDRALTDLASYYRDVLAVQLGLAAGAAESPVSLVNADLAPSIRRLAETSTPEATLRRLGAVLACGEAIDANVAPLLAVESMTLALLSG
ncbi:MAG TPA: DNA polymerase III subunit delta' [Mycobacteriales bacterium]|jgi:DNA polymerase-3 subunit delta'|nr:DNA polymerase III subunit delta' [Mycobacteriales bacterium]